MENIPKFRIFDKNSKRMIYPAEIVFSLGNNVLFKEVRESSDTRSLTPDFILMRSIGLSDKNGNIIYDKDILMDNNHRLLTPRYKMDRDLILYFADIKHMNNEQLTVGIRAEYHKELLVVGNLFDYPDLFKGGVLE